MAFHDVDDLYSEIEYLRRGVYSIEEQVSKIALAATAPGTWRYRVFARRVDREPIVETEVVNATVRAVHETTAYLMAHNLYWPAGIVPPGFAEWREEIALDP